MYCTKYGIFFAIMGCLALDSMAGCAEGSVGCCFV